MFLQTHWSLAQDIAQYLQVLLVLENYCVEGTKMVMSYSQEQLG